MAAEEYDQLLAKLDTAPSLVRRPLPAGEIDSLEKDLGLPVPAGVRAWLSRVGLFEDVSQVDASDFELHASPKELADSRRFIRELLGDAGADLFPFGHDGAGDEIAVRGGSGSDGRQDTLVFVDHETGRAHDIGPLRQWMSDVVEEAVRRAAEEPGEERFWCVQFTFRTPDERPIFETLRTVAPVKVPDNVWDEKPVTPAGVRPAKLGFVFLGQGRLLSRSTFEGWSSPSFALDYEEPVSVPADKSTIRRLDELFRARPELKYKLVDYGPLEWPPGEEDEDDPTPVPSKPWWKFW